DSAVQNADGQLEKQEIKAQGQFVLHSQVGVGTRGLGVNAHEEVGVAAYLVQPLQGEESALFAKPAGKVRGSLTRHKSGVRGVEYFGTQLEARIVWPGERRVILVREILFARKSPGHSRSTPNDENDQ